MSKSLLNIKKVIELAGNKERAKTSGRFFKTAKGEYGEGDKFWGIKVPNQRKIAKQFFKQFTLSEIKQLLLSPYHEERFIALEMLVMQYEIGDLQLQEKIAKFYLQNSKLVNNWDLVDTSAPYILGSWLYKLKVVEAKQLVLKLVKSKNLWQRRIAIVSTQYLINHQQFALTLLLCKILLDDDHDLIHKACGWMLREVGKKDTQALRQFLDAHVRHMPRTMLRYSIERFPEKLRKYYLQK